MMFDATTVILLVLPAGGVGYVAGLLQSYWQKRPAAGVLAGDPSVPEAGAREARKAIILSQYSALASRTNLSPSEQRVLERLEETLSGIEIEEADEFDSKYVGSRAGRLEAALDRIEGYLHELRSTARS